MARPAATDYLHSMRFHVRVIAVGAGGNDAAYLEGGTGYTATGMGLAQAGFTTCSIPDLTIESVEYKEGTFVYPRKYPGNPALGECTFGRGVTRGDSSFWDWAVNSVEGSSGIEYRADLDIDHYHRDQILPNAQSVSGNPSANIASASISRTYHLFECFPTMCKPAGDLDATSSEISIQEMTVAVERMTVEEVSSP
jgi:phage tail-like protein